MKNDIDIIVEKGTVDITIDKTIIEAKQQTKEATPTKQKQTIIPDVGYNGLKQVIVNAIPDEYIIPTGTINITENGNTDVTDYAIANVKVPNFWTEPEMKDVNFIDYDGTLLYSYTLAEVQAMTELPELPQHPGLICQGWNWSLKNLKDFGKDMEVGAMYITDDGKTRIYIVLEYDGIEGQINFWQNVANSVELDWGDGSPIETFSTVGRIEAIHTFQNAGKYMITLYSEEEPYMIGYATNASGAGNDVNSLLGDTRTTVAGTRRYWVNSVKKVEIGKNVTQTTNGCFQTVSSLETITIPEGFYVYNHCFYTTTALRGCVLPRANNVAGAYNFAGSTCLRFLSFSDIYNDKDTIATTFLSNNSTSLQKLSLPNLKSIATWGQNAIQITKFEMPESLTEASANQKAFNGWNSLQKVKLCSSLTIIPNGFFQNFIYGKIYLTVL